MPIPQVNGVEGDKDLFVGQTEDCKLIRTDEVYEKCVKDGDTESCLKRLGSDSVLERFIENNNYENVTDDIVLQRCDKGDGDYFRIGNDAFFYCGGEKPIYRAAKIKSGESVMECKVKAPQIGGPEFKSFSWDRADFDIELDKFNDNALKAAEAVVDQIISKGVDALGYGKVTLAKLREDAVCKPDEVCGTKVKMAGALLDALKVREYIKKRLVEVQKK